MTTMDAAATQRAALAAKYESLRRPCPSSIYERTGHKHKETNYTCPDCHGLGYVPMTGAEEVGAMLEVCDGAFSEVRIWTPQPKGWRVRLYDIFTDAFVARGEGPTLADALRSALVAAGTKEAA